MPALCARALPLDRCAGRLQLGADLTAAAQRFFSRTGLCLWIGATIGAVCVLPYVKALLPQAFEAATELHGMPPFVLIALSIAQSAVLLGLTSFSGLWAARKLGLGAPVIDAWLERGAVPSDLRRSALTAVGLGIAAGLLALALDLLVFLPLDPHGLGRLAQSKQPSAWKGFLASFYGGIGEEVLLRIFLLSFLALGIRRIRDFLFPPAARSYPRPSSGRPTSSRRCSSVWDIYRPRRHWCR